MQPLLLVLPVVLALSCPPQSQATSSSGNYLQQPEPGASAAAAAAHFASGVRAVLVYAVEEAEGGDGQIGNVSRELCDMIAYSKLLEASPLTNESKELQSLAIVLNETVRSHCIIASGSSVCGESEQTLVAEQCLLLRLHSEEQDNVLQRLNSVLTDRGHTTNGVDPCQWIRNTADLTLRTALLNAYQLC